MTTRSREESRPEFEIVWSAKALSRLREIRQYVGADKPEAATRLAARIVSVVAVLRIQPRMGRAGAEPGTRELVIGGTPYIVIYKVGRNSVTILTIWHGAQQRHS
jgi:toxin ParE1/3/4